MVEVNLEVEKKCVVNISVNTNKLGRSTLVTKAYNFNAGKARLIIDDSSFMFVGNEKKQGFIQAVIKNQDVRSAFLNVRKMNLALVVVGIILIAAGAVIPTLFWFFLLYTFPLFALIPIGIILLVAGLKRSVIFSVYVTSNLYEFIKISVKSVMFANKVKKFIENMWPLIQGTQR
ncbi:MAG: hypothetical protein ACTSWN_00655 [Promethearchaeota archaeon]